MMAAGKPAPLEGHAQPGSDADAARLASRVLAAQVQLVYDLAPRALAASMAVSSLAAFFFHSRDHPLATPLWWVLLAAVSAERYRLVRRFREASPEPEAAPYWARQAVLGGLASGMLWGYCAVALGPRWGAESYPLAVFLIAGIPAVGLISNSPLLSVYLALQLPILLPYAAKLVFFHEGQLYPLLGGVAALIYALVLAAIGRTVNRRVAESFELRFRNLDLVQRLSGTNQELQAQIARREQDERALLQARDTAEAADRAKSRFLAKMSHEIRTPINGVFGMSELLLHSELSVAQRRCAGIMAESAHSLLRIMNDVLDLSRTEAGGLALEPDDFDLRRSAGEAVDLLREGADKGGLALTLSVEDRVPARVRGDAGRLRQVLVNLVGNAVKFTPRGGVRVSVSLAEGSNPDPYHLRFAVQDTGIGIAQAEQEKLFQPFVQLDERASRQFDGLGIGLVISRRLIDLMGGRIGVESVPGAGSEFWFDVRFEPPRGSPVAEVPGPPASADVQAAP